MAQDQKTFEGNDFFEMNTEPLNSSNFSDLSEFDYYLLLMGHEKYLTEYCNIQRPEYYKVQ